MHLLANGCSNTHGAETHNVGISEENRNLAYPRYIADYFSMSYKNIAQPGASNEYIAHTTIKWIEEYNGKLDELFVVIGFTTSVRKSLINENGNFYWNTLHKDPGKIWGTKQNFCELEDYFNLWLEYDTYPEYYDNICVHYINYIHLYLKNKKIKHFFIDGAGGSFLDSKDHEILSLCKKHKRIFNI